VLALVLVAAVGAYVIRRRSNRDASLSLHRRALDAYASAIALHDQAAVLLMTADADELRMSGEVLARLDRVTGEFDALATEPRMQDVSAEIEAVRLSLGNFRGTLQAHVEARGIHAELLRERLVDLDGALQRFRQRVSPTPE
jgi:hypothetical protein